MSDWRTPASGDREIPLNLATLFARLHLSSEDKHHDVTFKLPDGGEVGGHKIVLAVASPVFEAQFYGPMAADNTDVVAVRDVEPGGVFSRTIKLMLERQKSSIYQHEMLLECAKITPYQQDMSH